MHFFYTVHCVAICAAMLISENHISATKKGPSTTKKISQKGLFVKKLEQFDYITAWQEGETKTNKQTCQDKKENNNNNEQ